MTTQTEKQMSGLILEALMELSDKTIYLNDVGTPDLETIADYVAAYIVKKGFWMEG